jgi:hypothetical protein
MKIEIQRYRKPDGYVTRNWAIYVNGELLAVVLYRKGAQAIADLIQKTLIGEGEIDAA